jgi:hypothetical protein
VSRVVVTVAARADIDEAWLFYEQREQGIGDYFESTIWTDIESLTEIHDIHRFHSGYNRMHASRFPYAIYYRETPEETQVVAIMDLRRRPDWLRRQLRHR